jgi:hypothetical protein
MIFRIPASALSTGVLRDGPEGRLRVVVDARVLAVARFRAAVRKSLLLKEVLRKVAYLASSLSVVVISLAARLDRENSS